MVKNNSTDQFIAMYRTMVRIRKCEEQLARSFLAGQVHGACHTYVGEEAVATGVCAHLNHEDAVFSTHRGHGHALAKGVTAQALIAELFGRETGCSRGRGGSMHLFAPEIGLMGTSGIVGPCILQAAGAGYAARLLNTRRVSVAFFGDGAVNNGAFHEGLNMAAIWSLPVLFICENNLYATEIAFSYASRNPSVVSRAKNYGMPGMEVDGNDVMAVYYAAGDAVDRARKGGGPTLIECKTYRTRSHAEGMRDLGYRSAEELEKWKRKDPIDRHRQWLLDEGHADPAILDAIEGEISEEVADAVRFAENSPWPEPSTSAKHVFREQ